MVIQMDGKLRQSADIEKTVRCLLPEKMMETKVIMQSMKKKILRYSHFNISYLAGFL